MRVIPYPKKRVSSRRETRTNGRNRITNPIICRLRKCWNLSLGSTKARGSSKIRFTGGFTCSDGLYPRIDRITMIAFLINAISHPRLVSRQWSQLLRQASHDHPSITKFRRTNYNISIQEVDSMTRRRRSWKGSHHSSLHRCLCPDRKMTLSGVFFF